MTDDDADDLELVSGFFKEFNPDVTVVELHDGREVIHFLSSLSEDDALPLLLLLDVNMPRFNGKETLLALRNILRFQYLPAVIYTTSTGDSERAFFEDIGASWVTKPGTMDGVRQTAKVIADFCKLKQH